MRNCNGEKVPVCQKLFLTVLGISRKRITTIMKHFLQCGDLPRERRGGDRKTRVYQERKDCVMAYINSFQYIESHYCRSQSAARKYLSSELKVRKMWRMYNEKPRTIPVKHSYFRHIFNRYYNLGFSTPRTDVCSTFLQLQKKIRTRR